MRSLAEWFIHGEVDWEWWQENGRKWAPVVSGALFGAAWWIWVDALVHEEVATSSSPPFKYNWPGIVATIALLLINLVSREDLAEISVSGEDGADTRARIWLLISFVMAVSSVAGSVMVLISCTQAKNYVGIGVASVGQTGLILASALLFWALRTERDGAGYGFI